MIIPKITDVYVTLDTIHPQAVAGLDKAAIFVAGSTESFKQYLNLSQIAVDYPANSSVSNVATAILSQYNAPSAVNVITYVKSGSAPAPSASGSTGTSSNSNVTDANNLTGAAKAAYDYFYLDWEFAILADYDKTEATNLATVIDGGGYDGKGFHLFFQQFGPSNVADASAFDGFNRTFKFYHTDESEEYAAALLGNTSSLPVGSVSWKFSSNLDGITPETIPAVQIESLVQQGFILYVTKAANSNQTGDSNKQGNYIDFIHGEDWIKANIESEVQNLLSTSTRKVGFDDDGVALIADTVNGVLKQGANQGIIETDPVSGKPAYKITPPDVSQLTPAQKATRILDNFKAAYNALNGVNEVHIHVAATE